MTREELKTTLLLLEPGKAAGLHHEVYADIFPPGEPDETARASAYALARSTGCHVEIKPNVQTVWFVKDT
jgi:hypothetical protein